jgi:antitoxin YefM
VKRQVSVYGQVLARHTPELIRHSLRHLYASVALAEGIPITEAVPARQLYAIMYMRRRIVKVMSMSESRANYAATLDSVINDQEEVVITRPGGEDVVMIPLREYESMRETLYLMSSPVNRQRISRSIEQLNRGSGQVHELIDPDGGGE